MRCILIHWFNYKSLSNFCILLSYFQLRYSRDLRILKYLKTVPDKWGLTRQVIDHITKSRPVQVTFERESAKTTLALFSNIERTNNITRKVSSAWTWLCSISFVVRECRTLHCFSHRKNFKGVFLQSHFLVWSGTSPEKCADILLSSDCHWLMQFLYAISNSAI